MSTATETSDGLLTQAERYEAAAGRADTRALELRELARRCRDEAREMLKSAVHS